MNPSTPAPRRVLLMKPSSFGDIVNTLPALSALRHAWPQSEIDWIVKPEWAPLLKNHPMLDEVLPFPGSFGDWRRMVGELRRRNYDMTIDFQGLLRSGLLSALSGVRTRAGFAEGREGSRWFYTHAIPTSGAAVHVVERNLQLIEGLGVAVPRERSFPLPRDVEAEEWAERLWTKEQIRPDEIVCLVHTGTRRETKRWPAERFAALIGRLASAENYRVVSIAAGAERGRFTDGPARAPIDLTGETTLPQLIALTRRAALLVTNDSGPMHLAAALGVPVVALFGPTDPGRVGPYGEGHVVLRKDVDCSRCTRHRCVKDLECMKAIQVDEVYAAVTSRMEKTARATGRQREASEGRRL